MSTPFVPMAGRSRGEAGSPRVVAASPVSSPQVVSQPQQQKIVQDILDCIKDMKTEYESSSNPIDDDNQTLHRFCAKLEYLLQANMKDKYTVLGKRKDYWDYFCSCLASTKGMNDGLKYVKTIGDYKTSVGKGRAYIRFCLMHQRLADSIQQCVMNGKATSDWFHPKSIWLQHGKSSAIVSALYDLSELKFDLTPRGYDLDNAWPSFARKNVGSHNWNPPSRADSMSSLISIPGQDLDSSRYGLSSTPNDSIDHLTHELATSESVRSDLADKIEALEHQKLSFQQSILESRKELESTQSHLNDLKSQQEALQMTNKDLQQKHDRLTLEVEAREKEWAMKETMYQKQIESANSATEKLQTQISLLEDKLQKSESSRKDSENSTISRLSELETSKNDYHLQIRTLTQDLESSKMTDSKKAEIISDLEGKLKDLEAKNLDLLHKMESVLVNKNEEASSQLNSTARLQEVLVNLKEVETENLKRKSEKEELLVKFSNKQTEVESLRKEVTAMEESCRTEKENFNLHFCNLNEDIEREKKRLNEEISDLKMKFSNVSQDLLSKSEENSKLLQESTLMKENIVEKEDEIKQLKNVIEEKTLELQNFELSCKEKISQLEESEKSSLSLLIQQEEALSKLKSELNEKEQNLEQLTSKVEKIELEKVEMRQTVNSIKQCNQDLENVKSDLDKELNSLKEQQNIERGTTDEVKEALENKMTALRETETKVERLKQVLVWIGNNAEQQDGQIPPKLDNETLSESISKFWESYQNKCTSLAELQENRVTLTTENQSLQQKIDDQGRELNEFKEKLSSLSKQYESVIEKEKSAQKDKTDVERKLDQLSKDIELKKKELENKYTELQKVTTEYEKLSCESENCKVELNKKLEEIAVLKDASSKSEERLQKSEKVVKEVSATQKTFSDKIQQQEKVIEESKNKVAKLENDIQALESAKSTLSQANSKLSQENEVLRKEVSSLQNQLTQKLSVIESNEKILSHNKEDKAKMDKKYKEVQTNLFDSEQKLSVLKFEKEKQEKDHSKMLGQLEGERKNLTESLEEALSDLGSIKEQLKETSSELENAYHEKEKIETEKEQVLLSKSELESLLAEYTERTKKLDSELENRNQDLTNFKDKFSNLEVDNETLKKERTESQEELERVKQEFENVTSKKDEELKQLNNIQLDLSEKLFNLNEENCRVNEVLESLKKEKEEILKEKNETENHLKVLQSDVNDKSTNISEIERKNCELLSAIDTLKNSLEEKERIFETELKEMEEKLRLEIDTLKQENSAMQFQLSSEQMQHEQALQTYSVQETSISDMKEKLVEQETMIEQLELQMAEIKAARDEEKLEQKQQLEELLILVNIKDHELTDIESKLQVKTKELEEEKSKVDMLQTRLEEEHSDGINIRKKQEDEIVILKSDTVQLKKKLVKLIKEKDTLWQKTDRLAFQQKIQAKEKWLDDSKISTCMGCNAEFSFTLRKHHCRLCGRVFCYNCSNNWINTAHSSKKERACNSCYIRQSQLEEDSSLIDNDSEDDIEKSVDLPKMHKSRTGPSMTQSLSPVIDEDDKSSSTQDDNQSEHEDGIVAVIPGQVASGISVSMVDNETDEIKTAKKTGDESEDVFHLISDEEIAKSLTLSDESYVENDPNLTKSLTISTDELEKGEVNSFNEIWIKPGKSFAVPVLIETVNTTLCWEFKSHPKDVVFSVCFQSDSKSQLTSAQALVPSCKCDSHKQAVKGELTAKQVGVYTLIFDNTYSRLTSKKISYSLWSKKS